MFESGRGIVNRRSQVWLTAGLGRCWSLSLGLGGAIGAALFPPRCCLCSFQGAAPALDLCEYCRVALPWATGFSEGRFVALHFTHPADDIVRQLKYHGVIANARVLGTLLAQCAQEHRVELPNLLIPVPLHSAKMRERGFNQATAIARYTGRLLDISVARAAVVRVRNTPSQTFLDVAARHRNVSGAFEINGARRQRRLLEAAHVAILDDVITTGSTVNELRRVLLAAGVRRVDVWAVAKAS